MRTLIAKPALAAFAVLLMGVASACAENAAATPSAHPSPTAPPATVSPSLPTSAATASAPSVSATASNAPSASGAPSASVTASNAPSASGAPSSPALSPDPSVGEARLIELEETSDLRIKQNGEVVTDIPVTPGETIRFVITNTAGFDHDFYIGTDQQLSSGHVEGLPGIKTWSNREPQQFDWTVPEDVSALRFGCSLRGHYQRMNGTFSIKP